MAKENGGPAFPAKVVKVDIAGNKRHSRHGGMTLRDYFAGQALAGILAGGWRPDSTSRAAYVYADAMLAERDK